MKENYSSLRFHKFGKKSVKLLSHLIKGDFVPTPIRSLRNKHGTIQNKPKDINRIFMEYYASLYSKDHLDTKKAAKF